MSTLLRVVSRFMLAVVFIRDGVDATLNPDDHVERFRKIEPALEKIGAPPVLTSDAKLLSRLAGSATAITGIGLALGKYPRLCAFILAVANFPITVVNNQVWTAKTDSERHEYWRGLVVGSSLAGGLGMAMLDRKGKPSLQAKREIIRNVKSQIEK